MKRSTLMRSFAWTAAIGCISQLLACSSSDSDPAPTTTDSGTTADSGSDAAVDATATTTASYSLNLTCDDVGNTGKTYSDSVNISYVDACSYSREAHRLHIRLYSSPTRSDSSMVAININPFTGPGEYETDAEEEGISVVMTGAAERCEGDSFDGAGCADVPGLCKIKVLETNLHQLDVSEAGERKDGTIKLEMTCGKLLDFSDGTKDHYLGLSQSALTLNVVDCTAGM